MEAGYLLVWGKGLGFESDGPCLRTSNLMDYSLSDVCHCTNHKAFRIYSFVMHLLKSMGGGAFGGSKPSGPPAKSTYFSSLKLEY